MIHSLHLTNFKNFKDATLKLGRLTLLVGANASGKSNLRDAFRFLHAIGQGYTIAEILGEKYVEGGALQWKGIRGGVAETARHGKKSFALETHLGLERVRFVHRIEVVLTKHGPRVVKESLHHNEQPVFVAGPATGANGKLAVQPDAQPTKWLRYESQQPVLTQFLQQLPRADQREHLRQPVLKAIADLKSMRFLDLAPEAMRRPSVPGQTTLGDRGENLSSVLQAMCESRQTHNSLREWIKQLTPMDVADFEFVPDATGRILVTLVESDGSRTSAHSASDGSLRFLGVMAALLGPKKERLIFMEEIDTGLHPTRLHLLMELVEHSVAAEKMQLVGTTHSPYLLAMLSERAREDAHLVYRLEGSAEGRIRRIMDIPDARRLLKEQGLARLYESGWLEDTVAFAETAETAK
jgi:predicted ATPase